MRQDSSSPTKSSGLRLAATASPRTHQEPETKEEDEALVVQRSRKYWRVPASLMASLARRSMPRMLATFATDCSSMDMGMGMGIGEVVVLHLHLHRGQGLNMGDSTIGRAAVMCRRSLACTSALANRELVAVKVGCSQRLFWALHMHKSHVERSLARTCAAPRFKLFH